jgi:hypothetical protein
MKTILDSSNVSKYIVDDAEPVSLETNRIVIGNPVSLYVADMNASNSSLIEGVTPPEDWVGCKYLFDGTTWTQNPSWVEPE